MRNYNDIGNVHFDESTREMIVDRAISAEIRGQAVTVPLRIPLTILKALKQQHFDQAQHLITKRYDVIAGKFIMNGVSMSLVSMATIEVLKKEICEMLYSEFTIEQSKRGNSVWATPQTMQEIGPPPEEDERYVQEGLIQ